MGTYTENAELGERRVLVLDGLDVAGDLGGYLGRGVLSKECAQLLLLVLVVGRVAIAIISLTYMPQLGVASKQTSQWGRARHGTGLA